jgi:hypothetical protein
MGMLDDADDLGIVAGVIQLAAVFKRQVIAEGVETMAHGMALRKLGCSLVQGYGIARPMPAQALPDWIRQWQQQAAWQQLDQVRPSEALSKGKNDNKTKCRVWLVYIAVQRVGAGVSAGNGRAVVLQIGFGSNKPPYVFEAERRGLEFDIVVAAARRAGMEVQPFFAPMERLQGMLQQGRLDGIATTNPYSQLKAYFSQPYWNITMWRSRWRSASWC